MTNRVPTERETRFIRLALYVPTIVLSVVLLIAGCIHQGKADPVSFFFVVLVIVAVLAIGRKVELSRQLVIPTKEEVFVLTLLLLFMTGIRAVAGLFWHHSEWLKDLIYYNVAYLVVGPHFLFFRKRESEEVSKSP